MLGPPVWCGGLAISRDLRLNPMDTVCTYVTPFSRIRDRYSDNSDSDAAPRGRLLSRALARRNYTALLSRATVASLRLPACSWLQLSPPPLPSPAASKPASPRISTGAARHRLALTHHVSFRQKNAPMPCVQTPAASWQEVDGFERGGSLLSHPVQSHD